MMSALLLALVIVATPSGAGPGPGLGTPRERDVPAPATLSRSSGGEAGLEREPARRPLEGPERPGERTLGDEAYARFDNEAALGHYEKAVEAEPSDDEALWRVALAHADVGKALEEKDRDEAGKHYRAGEESARRAIAANPDSVNGHFVLAVCLGRRALLEGVKTRIRLSKEVKREAERTIELDPGHDGAYSVLGRWNYAIATLGWLPRAFAKVIYGGVPPGASVERAAEMFRKAVELDPTRGAHHLEYARALVALGRYSEARGHLERCLALPRVQWDDPANKEEAARMLKDIEGRKDEP